MMHRLTTLTVCLALASATLPGRPAVADGISIGSAPPDYLGVTTAGDEFRLSDGLGRLQVLSFWASWCAPCLKELPVLNNVQKHGGSNRFRVVGINYREPMRDFSRAMRAFEGFEIDFIHDQRGSVASQFGVNALPHTLVLDVDGTVVHQYTGFGDDSVQKIVDDLNALLQKNDMVHTAPE
jgi:thiol-disulfide isomerase/thioredoxin